MGEDKQITWGPCVVSKHAMVSWEQAQVNPTKRDPMFTGTVSHTVNKDHLIYQQVVMGPAIKLTPVSCFLLGLGMGTMTRGRSMQYLSGAIWELVGQKVAIDLSGGVCPSQYPLRLGHSRRTKVSGRVDV